MNIPKFVQIKFFGGRLLVLLVAILLVVGLFSTQTPNSALGMRREDPTDTDPIGVGDDPPEYTAPYEGFTWSMEKRFGPDRNGDGMVDYHWDPVSMTYDPSYVYPTSWKITFNGCQTGEDYSQPADTVNYYRWTLDGTNLTTTNCKPALTFTDKLPHTVQLTVEDANGNAIVFRNGETSVQQTVTIKDYFIVSIGDSYASGQGNPDIPQTYVSGPFGVGWILGTPAEWQDDRCMRSAKAGPALAALALEAGDPHSSVTFISFACSGASLNTSRYDDDDPFKNVGTGILGKYRGEQAEGIPYNEDSYIKSQMQQVSEALVPPSGQTPRQIDALIISAGGNDIHFGDIASKCILFTNCWFNWAAKVKESPGGPSFYLYDLVDRALGLAEVNPPNTVPASYDALGVLINDLNPKPANVYVTQYPDPTKGTNREYCRMLDDVFWPNPLNVITDAEAETASTHATLPLNNTIRAAVDRLAQAYSEINWQLVDGLSSFDVDPDLSVRGRPGLFVGGPENGPGHGYCASDRWINKAEDSELIQGPLNWRAGTKGTLHPNISGHQVYKARILYYMLPDLTVQPPQEPPTFSFSYTSAGLTSQAGLNGWYIRSRDGNNNEVNPPKVVAQAVAASSVVLNGASVSVNDESGCTLNGVICDIDPSSDGKQVTYRVEISVSGIYRFQFNAQDSSGQVSFLLQEIKVDLENPVLATPIGPFSVEEGGLVVVSANVATDSEDIPLNDDVVVDYDWDLDNDDIFETTDEQPSFSAEELDGPASQTIQVQVTDRAGRTATAQTTVDVSNVAPSVNINGAPASSAEGTAINLTSTVTDPGAADSFTYAWVVKKDGSNYASGANANFSFTPDENGVYEVSLSVTDDDGGVGTATSQTIAVTNVAPTLSNVAVSSTRVNEGASFTLSGDITEPGSADTLALTIDWADGSTPELVSLPAGSTSFNRSHTYADDNPTGTASDIYSVALTITDDDGSTGTVSASVVVDNLPPSLTISAPENGTLYAVNATVNVSASLADPSNLDTLTCSINWDDGVTEPGALAAGVCTGSHVYTAAGVYTIQLTGTDDDTGAETGSVMAVVYDPSEGFVTGGGWIDSPAGAYAPDPSLAGRADFGFVSKYHRGATIPSGQTEFQFEAGSFYFESEAYDWLVVAGARAQFKGTGSVNGVSGYGFLLTLTDGDINGGGGVDKFRIKVWDAVGVVYDNMLGAPEDIDGANPQAIGGGNIMVHTNR